MENLKPSSVRKLDPKCYLTIHCKVPSGKFWLKETNLPFPRPGSSKYLELNKPLRLINHVHRYWRHSSLRAFAAPVRFNEEPLTFSQPEQMSKNNELDSKDQNVFSQKPEPDEGEQMSHNNELYSEDEDAISQKPESAELKSMLADSERGKLLRKLSEANQYNRLLRRKMLNKDEALVNFKNELASLELELQALVGLAEEIANGPPIVSRKINGKYITSYLLSRLQAVQEKVKEHVKDIDSVEVKDTVLFWCGMAESVQVMGSFDGWTQGEEMSPEYMGSFTKFSVTMRLRPGSYEIKFLVDGEWQLSPELPTVGEEMMINNLLIVE